MKTVVSMIAAGVMLIASLGIAATASAGNPHCAGNSDNINLPSGHVNNFGGCK